MTLTCHKCGFKTTDAEGGHWLWLTLHRQECDPDNYVHGIPFWMLEQRLLDKEYAILWMTSSKASRKALGEPNHRCWA